jgi:hypothetical protein
VERRSLAYLQKLLSGKKVLDQELRLQYTTPTALTWLRVVCAVPMLGQISLISNSEMLFAHR